MSIEDNKALMHRFWAEVNKGNLAIWDEVCTHDYIYHGTTGDKTREESKKHAAGLLTAFPDLNVTVDDMIAEGDYLAVRYTIRGTHKGDYAGITPTGKRITLSGIELDRLTGGKFVETWGISDTLGLMQQLGAIPKQ